MNNIKTKAVKLSLAAVGLVLAASAQATPAPSTWIDLTDLVSINGGLGSFDLGNNHIVQFTDDSTSHVNVAFYGANLAPNDVPDVLASLPSAGLFGLTPSSVVTYGAPGTYDNISGSATLHPTNNSYMAFHFGGSEMLFHWANNAPASFIITSDKLSNYRAFTSTVPEPETYGMLLAGLGLVGFLARRRKAA